MSLDVLACGEQADITMTTILENNEELKAVLKSAIIEILQERQDLVRSILQDVIEDIAFSKAISEGEQTPAVSREQVFELLETAN